MNAATSLARKERVTMTSKLCQIYIQLITVRKQTCQPVRTVYIKRVKGFPFGHIINILLTELSRSVWENLDLGREYKPHCVRSVLHDLGQDSLIQTSCYVNKS